MVGSVLFTHADKKPLEYFIQLTGRTVSRFFSRPFSSQQFLKTLTHLIVLIHVFRFSVTSFDAVTSFARAHYPQQRLVIEPLYNHRVNPVKIARQVARKIACIVLMLSRCLCCAPRGGGVLPYWAIYVCAVPKGMVFQLLCS